MTEEWVNMHNHEVLAARAIVNPDERRAKLESLEQERIYETLRCQAHMADRVKRNEKAMSQVQTDVTEIKACQQNCKARAREDEAERRGMKKGAKFVIGTLTFVGGAFGWEVVQRILEHVSK